MKIKNIIFDLGGVLIDWNPKYVYRQIFESEKEVDWFLENIATYDWNVEQDAGRTLEEATHILTEKHPKWHKEIAAYYGRWEEMLGGPIEENIRLLEQLVSMKEYRVLALTNWSYETWPIALERYGYFLDWFEDILVSGKEKMKKPEARIYNLMLSRNNLIAEESVFIDDSLKNVKGAESCRIHAVHYRTPENLKDELGALLARPL